MRRETSNVKQEQLQATSYKLQAMSSSKVCFYNSTRLWTVDSGLWTLPIVLREDPDRLNKAAHVVGVE